MRIVLSCNQYADYLSSIPGAHSVAFSRLSHLCSHPTAHVILIEILETHSGSLFNTSYA